ncbi:hypothetical protein AMTR_s00011p00232500, partial [Amborella trichopoda]
MRVTERRSLRWILNAIKAQALDVQPASKTTKELMYVDIQLNGRSTMPMVDTGATHNFISGDEAKRLGLHLEKDSSRLKAVNSEAKPLLGVAKAVELKLGGWSGTVNLSAVPMNDFRVILGMDFLRAAKVAPMPYLGVVSIMDTKTPCMVTAAKGEKGK